MGWTELLFIYIAILLGCLLGGVTIGAAMGVVGLIGLLVTTGTSLWQSLGAIVWNTTTDFSLVSIPLFVLMGELVLQGGIANRFYSGALAWFRRIPGGLAHTNIAGCAVFSAIAGSSVVTALTVGSVAIKEMRSRGYSDKLTFGTIAAGGSLGILIPPSIPLIVYSAMTQVSVIDLFAAGIIPGIVLAVAFSLFVGIKAFLQPHLLPKKGANETSIDWKKSALGTLPVVILILAVINGMYFGIVTPTEASAFGCLAAALIALVYRGLTWARLQEAMVNTLLTSAVILFITICAKVMSFAVLTAGIGDGIAQWLVGIEAAPLFVFCALVLIFIVLGMFVDGLSVMLLTVPILYAPLLAMGFDPIWLGILIVIFIEVGAITPPVGLNLFAVQSIVPGTTLSTIAASSFPYCLIIIGFAFALYAFPQIVLFLPELLK